MNLNQLFNLSLSKSCHFCNNTLSILFAHYYGCINCNNFIISYVRNEHMTSPRLLSTAFIINDIHYFFYNNRNLLHPYIFTKPHIYSKCNNLIHIPIDSFTSIPDAFNKISKFLILS